MARSRTRRAGSAIAALAALGAVLWLLFAEGPAPSRTSPTVSAPSAAEATGDAALWHRPDPTRAPESELGTALVERSETSAEAEAPERASQTTLGFGVRVRVLDEHGSPLGGWPVVLLREDPRWRELAESQELCEPGKKVKNCGLCHTEPDGAAPPTPPQAWTPRPIEGLYEADPAIARAITAEQSGECFFPFAPDGARYAVRLECTTEPFRSVAVEPASPPSLVELSATGIELVHLRVADDETWRLRPTLFAPWQSDGHAWAWASAETLVLGPGEKLSYPVETTAVLRFEAWIGRPFAPRLHLEPERSARGRELVLDRREYYVSAAVQLVDANGEPLRASTRLAELYERAPAREATLTTDGAGIARFLLDRSAPPSRERGISFSPWPKTQRAIVLPHPGNPDLPHPDRGEAHVDLAAAFDVSGELDLGVARLGTGPLLWKGRVVDGAGRGIPNAVAILCARSEAVPSAFDGSFERRGFSDGRPQMLSASAPGYALLGAPEYIAPQLELRLELHALAALDAHITAPPALLAHPVVLFVERADKEAAALNPMTDVRAESFDTEGMVRIEDLPATALRIAFKVENVRVHELLFEAQPGKNELPHLDLGALLKPLRFELAERVKEDALIRVRGFGASGPLFEELCILRAHLGTLQLWVPRACERWSVRYLGKQAEGSASAAQPIVLH